MNSEITIYKDDTFTIFNKPHLKHYLYDEYKKILLTYFYNDVIVLILDYYFDDKKKIMQLLLDCVFKINGHRTHRQCQAPKDYILDVYWNIKNYQPYISKICGNMRSGRGQLINYLIEFNDNDIKIIVTDGDDVIDNTYGQYEKIKIWINEIMDWNDDVKDNDHITVKFIEFENYITNYQLIPKKIQTILSKIYNTLIKYKKDIPNTVIQWYIYNKFNTINTNNMYKIGIRSLESTYNNILFFIDYDYTSGIRFYLPHQNKKFRFGMLRACRILNGNILPYISANNVNNLNDASMEYSVEITNNEIDMIYNLLDGWIQQYTD